MRGRNQESCRGTKWARYFASKLVCYIGKGREIKDPLEQRKYIFPVTIDIGNINMAVQQRWIILYTCRGVRNLPQQVASWVIFTVPPPWNLTYMRRISPRLQPLRGTPRECSSHIGGPGCPTCQLNPLSKLLSYFSETQDRGMEYRVQCRQELVRKLSGNVRNWSGNIRKWSKIVGKWSGNVSKWSGYVRKLSKIVRKWSKMVRKCSGNGQEMPKNGQKMSGNVRKCQEMVQNGQKIV